MPSSRRYPRYISDLAGKDLPGDHRYTITAETNDEPVVLGSGSWAFVLQAEGPLGDKKAVKILKQDRAEHAGSVERFLREADRMKEVQHPNIVSVESVGRFGEADDALPYYVMEYVSGSEITKWAHEWKTTGRFPTPDETASLIRQVLTALLHVHRHQIYHLDLKPANILVSTDGTPKVGDFGLARAVAADLPESPSPSPPPFRSLGGRELPAMHPRFRLLLGHTIREADLEPVFDLFGLGYTLSRIRDFLAARLDESQQYILDSLIFRLTAAELDHSLYPSRKRFLPAELAIDEYTDVAQPLEDVVKLENPRYHLVAVPELEMAAHPEPPIRIASGIHVPTTARVRAVIDTAAFQRLAWMRQLDLVHLVYPGAVHTRHEHALGTYYYTLRYLRRLLEHPYFVFHCSTTDIKATLLAGLLHDIGHFPLAHAVADAQELRLGEHEDVGRTLLEGKRTALVPPEHQEDLLRIIRRRWDVDPARVAAIAFVRYTREGELNYAERHHNLLNSIIDGPLDADKLHYLQMDSIHTGNPVGQHFDAEQLVDALTLTASRDGIAVTHKGVAAAESFLYARYRMHIDVYWHHTVRAARTLVGRAIDYFIRGPQNRPSRARRSIIEGAAISATDHDFLECLLEEFDETSASGKMIRHLIYEHVWPDGERRSTRPRRGVFKRIRTYFDDPSTSGAVRREVFHLLDPNRRASDLLSWEKAIAKALTEKLEDRIETWEVILDIPRPDEDRWPFIDVCDATVDGRTTTRSLADVSAVARDIGADFGMNASKIRLYCSPRVARLIEDADASSLNDWVRDAIRESRRRT